MIGREYNMTDCWYNRQASRTTTNTMNPWKKVLQTLGEGLPIQQNSGLFEWFGSDGPTHKSYEKLDQTKVVAYYAGLAEASARKWKSCGAPEHVVQNSGHLNIVAIDEILRTHEWPDHEGMMDLIVHGVPIVDYDFTATGIPGWTPRDPGTRSEDTQKAQGKPTWLDQEILDAIAKTARDDCLKGKVERIPDDEIPEIQRGLSFFSQAGFHASPWFGVRQKNKIREITNGQGANFTTTVEDKMRFPDHNLLYMWAYYLSCGQDISTFRLSHRDIAAEMRYAREDSHRMWEECITSSPLPQRSPSDIEGGTVDVKSAFQNLSPRDHRDNCFYVWDPEEGKNVYYRAKHCLFGHVSSIHAWCRFAEAIRFMIKQCLGYDTVIYVDDVIYFCTKGMGQKMLDDITAFLNALGIKLAPKSQMGTDLTLLGLDYDLAPPSPEVRVPQEKIEALLEKIREVEGLIAKNACKAVHLMRVTGSLNFYNVLARCGTCNRVADPVYDAYRGLSKRDLIPPQRIADLLASQALPKIRNTILLWPTFSISPVFRPQTIITDASCSLERMEAVISIMITSPGEPVVTLANRVPTSILRELANIITPPAKKPKKGTKVDYRRAPVIAILESVAILAAVVRFQARLTNSFTTIWTDNSAALFSHLKGKSGSTILAGLATTTKLLLMSIGAVATLRYIPSKYNPADGPTRQDSVPIIARILQDLGHPPTRWVESLGAEPTLLELIRDQDVHQAYVISAHRAKSLLTKLHRGTKN